MAEPKHTQHKPVVKSGTSSRRSYINMALSVGLAVTVVVAGYIVTHLSATGFYAGLEPESGTVATNAQIVNDSTASNGKAIQFNAPVVTPPPGGGGTGGGTSDCYPSATNCVTHWTSRCPAYPSFPDANCTGIPTGTQLTKYTGSCNINSTQVFDKMDFTNCGLLFIYAKNVVIKNSKIARIINDGNSNNSFIIQDSEVIGTTEQASAVSNTNLTVLGTNVHGSAASVQCSDYCTVIDSWLHGQYMPKGADWHDDAFITNGGSNMTITHNRIVCDEGTGACSGDIFLAADFVHITNVTADKNLLMADANVQYCAYGGSNRLGADHIVFTNNTFERGTLIAPVGSGWATKSCGKYGPVDIYDSSAPGNVWSNNKWDDGAVLTP